MKTINDPVEFSAWLGKSKPGDKVKYYDGLLMKDRQHFFATTAFTDKIPDTLATARSAWTAFTDGLVYLVQKRRDAFEYDYIAVKA